MHTGVIYALLAAALFGLSTPFAKLLMGQVAPVMLAGLLYLGSGIGLAMFYLLRRWRQQQAESPLQRGDLGWLAGAIAMGGVAGPLLLMLGLSLTAASTASLLLNMEGVLTALIAWFVFKENFDRRILVGMLLIVAAGVLLSVDQAPTLGGPLGTLCILGSCLCWAIDNNLTRKVAANDAVQIAALKGLVAGAVNLSIALGLGFQLPETGALWGAGLIGFCGYGLSLVMFVLALRHLGTARTGAYFSAAPFVGATASLALLGEQPGAAFWLAALLMGAGLWLHLTETHAHEHQHEAMEHEHEHRHDEHHQHHHDFEWDNARPHSHRHKHDPIRHTHPHYPDIHHQHPH